MPLVEKIVWAALKSLADLEKEATDGYVIRIKSMCGEITDTARFTEEEKKRNQIYCYTHKTYEAIKGVGKIKI